MTLTQSLLFLAACAVLDLALWGIYRLRGRGGLREPLAKAVAVALVCMAVPVLLAAWLYVTAEQWWHTRRRQPGHHRPSTVDVVPIVVERLPVPVARWGQRVTPLDFDYVRDLPFDTRRYVARVEVNYDEEPTLAIGAGRAA